MTPDEHRARAEELMQSVDGLLDDYVIGDPEHATAGAHQNIESLTRAAHVHALLAQHTPGRTRPASTGGVADELHSADVVPRYGGGSMIPALSNLGEPLPKPGTLIRPQHEPPNEKIEFPGDDRTGN